MDWAGRISSNPAVLGGRPVIAGTRVPVQIIVGALSEGETLDDVCEGYGISDQDVKAALAYAAEAVDYAAIYLVSGR